MAGLTCIAASEGEQALGAATAETIVQILAPANQRLKIKGWGVFFDGTSVTAEPIQVTLMRQTGAGTSAAGTPVIVDPGGAAETIQTASRKNFSAEPTTGNILDEIECHPQGGYEKQYTLGQEPTVPGGGRIGIQCTAPAAVNVRGKIIFEE